MVVVQLVGGLGNQLFQYAAGRALSLRTETELVLDIGLLDRRNQRPYQLSAFAVQARPARKRDVPFAFRQPYRSSLARKACGYLPESLAERLSRRPRVMKEMGGAFDERVTHVPGDVYLIGFWQSQKYFEDFADVIRSDLALSAERTGVAAGLAAEIRREGTVSLHVRRGDYLTHPLLSPCPVAYYRRALDEVAARAAVRSVYVFSDDIEWAKRELDLGVPAVFLDRSRARSDVADFFLMSRCHHHIIANSSFSWWAAWLGERLDGVVVSPRRWFNDPGIDTRDLRPAEWLVVTA